MKNINIKLILAIMSLSACSMYASSTTLGGPLPTPDPNIIVTKTPTPKQTTTQTSAPSTPSSGNDGMLTKVKGYASRIVSVQSWANGSQKVVEFVPGYVDQVLSYMPFLKTTYTEESTSVGEKGKSVRAKDALDTNGQPKANIASDESGKDRRKAVVKLGTNATTIAAYIIASIALFKYFTSDDEDNGNNDPDKDPVE